MQRNITTLVKFLKIFKENNANSIYSSNSNI